MVLFCLAQSEDRSPTLERKVPAMRTTFSDSTKLLGVLDRLRRLTLVVAEDDSSLRPRTPPLALISSTAISTPAPVTVR